MVEGPCWSCEVQVTVAVERGSGALVLLDRESVQDRRDPEAVWVLSVTAPGRPWRAERGVEITWAPRYRVHRCRRVLVAESGAG